MKGDYRLHRWGITEPPPNWLLLVNHQNHADRIYYILTEGAGYFYQNKRYYFRKNHFYILPSKCNLRFFVEDRKFNHFYIDFSNPTYLNYDRVIDFDIDTQPLIKQDVQAFMCFMRQKGIQTADKTNHADEFYSSLKRVTLLIDGLFFDINDAFPTTIHSEPIITKSIGYIQEHFLSNITVRELADNANLSENHFSRIFKSATGTSPYQYIKDYRFDIALSMIANGSSISDAAEKSGFLSVSAFSNSFKKRFGYPPTKIK